VEGLYDVRNEFLRFKNLKVLKLGINKLCLCHEDDRTLSKKLAETITNFGNIEELDLQENSINDTKFLDIFPALSSLKHLKRINLQNNPISNTSFALYLNMLAAECGNGLDLNLPENQKENQIKNGHLFAKSTLQSIVMNGCLLKDDGL